MKEATRLPEPLLERQREFIGFLRARLGTEEAEMPSSRPT
jgi:hypothetical protein